MRRCHVRHRLHCRDGRLAARGPGNAGPQSGAQCIAEVREHLELGGGPAECTRVGELVKIRMREHRADSWGHVFSKMVSVPIRLGLSETRFHP